jgi:mRNA-degrading endonuclease RelE of RelBE toxin-antitoxin system
MAQVKFDPGVPEEFDRLPRVMRARMITVFERLQEWPNVAGVRPLRGRLAGRFRIRTGDYRVQFRFEAGEIRIEKVGHRDRFYED